MPGQSAQPLALRRESQQLRPEKEVAERLVGLQRLRSALPALPASCRPLQDDRPPGITQIASFHKPELKAFTMKQRCHLSTSNKLVTCQDDRQPTNFNNSVFLYLFYLKYFKFPL